MADARPSKNGRLNRPRHIQAILTHGDCNIAIRVGIGGGSYPCPHDDGRGLLRGFWNHIRGGVVLGILEKWYIKIFVRKDIAKLVLFMNKPRFKKDAVEGLIRIGQPAILPLVEVMTNVKSSDIT